MLARFQYPHVFRLYDLGTFHHIGIVSSGCLKLDDVVLLDLAQTAKQRVAMSRDANVPGVSRQRRPRYVAESHLQRVLTGPLTNHGAHVEARDRQPANQGSIFDGWRCLLRRSATRPGDCSRSTIDTVIQHAVPPALEGSHPQVRPSPNADGNHAGEQE
jgi:hypothetical protein